MAKIQTFDPRQEMRRGEFEIQHKRDTYLNTVALHHHDFYEIFFLVSGDVTYAIESRLYHVLPGDILVISPRELHQVFVRRDMDPYERYVLWVDKRLLERLSRPGADLGRCLDPTQPGYSNSLRPDPALRRQIQSWMEQIFQESEQTDFASGILQESLICQLLIALNRQFSPAAKEAEPAQESPVVEQVVRYVNLHYGEELSLAALSQRFHVSRYHLCHEFQRQMGSGVYRYIQKKRLQIARQLLAEGNKPNTVYAVCGFTDYTGFYRAFKAEYGICPRQYHTHAKSNPERTDTQ